MELLGLEFSWDEIFKRQKIERSVSFLRRKNKLNPLQLFEYFYHVETPRDLTRAIVDDVIVSVFMGVGSGLFSSFLRGLYFKLFINYKYPALIGRFFKIINRSMIKIGRVFWAKDGVNLFAGGPLVIGDSCVFAERSAVWSGKEGVFIGDRCFLGVGSYISAIRGKVKIGRDVMIADHVRFYTWNHKFEGAIKKYSEMSSMVKNITIGDNCWLGTGCIILPGVKLGKNSVAAAGSVLTGSYPEKSLVGGVPAKVIRKIR